MIGEIIEAVAGLLLHTAGELIGRFLLCVVLATAAIFVACQFIPDEQTRWVVGTPIFVVGYCAGVYWQWWRDDDPPAEG